MRLTSFTDLGVRALMRMASTPERAFPTSEIADEFGISRHHLTKAVAVLSNAGILVTRRGGRGGAMLARPADQIRLGEVVRILEADQALVECFRAVGGACVITGRCRLRHLLAGADEAFLTYLDGYTLADCALQPKMMAETLA